MSTELQENVETEVKKPSDYKVVLLNDNYTAVDFVVHVLEMVFNKSKTEAQKITEEIHHNGKGIAGIYSYEIAKTKLMILDKFAKENNYPLKGIMEKVDD